MVGPELGSARRRLRIFPHIKAHRSQQNTPPPLQHPLSPNLLGGQCPRPVPRVKPNRLEPQLIACLGHVRMVWGGPCHGFAASTYQYSSETQSNHETPWRARPRTLFSTLQACSCEELTRSSCRAAHSALQWAHFNCPALTCVYSIN